MQIQCLGPAVLFWAASCASAFAELPAIDRARAANYCADKWTERGSLDRDMFNYCMEQQAEGYDDALAFQKKYGELPDLDQISNYAARKWLKAREYQYDMVAYEMENQIDAFLNISYDLKSGRYAERDVRSCIAKWYTEDEPQWDMVEYCLEN